MMESYWRCVPCGVDIRFGTRHTCAIAARVVVPVVSGPRTPWPAQDYAPHEVGKE